MLKRVFNQTKGQAAVELALILPVLLLILLGIMEGGRIFAGHVELQHAARDGARYAAIHTDKTAAEVRTYVDNRLVMLSAAKLNFSFVRDASADKKDRWVVVNLSYPLEIVTPIISALAGNPFNLQAGMTMRSE